ncbi:hypothetical protein Poli38472_004958 [Pythium oligandrum]|uniref:N-acetyltransferase domain-containing protein n=1 Tax=Pythium oligandrum TaxID=41045 RepID=A0A8K1CAR3_PYTOL|nr:hypothetical protein Poli38472_004958 [Pythium oligandrum]|eukprot:TMW59889.1 hypothetical protein Poli38472_004958 [Pythium oligandrum]
MTAASASIDFGQLRIRKTARKDVTLVGEILVDGFHDDPFWGCIDLHSKYPKAEKFFFKRWARIVRKTSFVVVYKDEIIGHYYITPPNDPGPTFWKLMQYGLYQLPIRFGWTLTKRTIDLLDTDTAARNLMLDQRPSSEVLDAFVIKSEWRGRGIGTHVLEEFILKDRPRLALFAHKKKVVELYEKVGFRTLDQRMVSTGHGHEYESWGMEYTAPAKTS